MITVYLHILDRRVRDIVLIICIKDNVVVIHSKEGVPDLKKKAQI